MASRPDETSWSRRFSGFLEGKSRGGKGGAMPTWLWIVVIVLLVLVIFGGVGYGRRA